METKKDGNSIEQQIHNDLHQYLLSRGMVDERLPQAPDIEELWTKVGESYLPDGMREFGAYPIVSIGWMMFIGMAIAKLWDTEWERYSKEADLYKYLRDQRDFDHMDEYSGRMCITHAQSALPQPARTRYQRGFPGLCVGLAPDVSHGYVDGTQASRLSHDQVGLSLSGHIDKAFT